MTARLLRLFVLALGGLALLWGVWFQARGQALIGWLGAILIVAGYAVVLAIELAIAGFANRRHGDIARPTFRQLTRAWVAEALLAPCVFCWRQPFRSEAVPDELGDRNGPRSQAGVLLVHGFACNRAFWNPWMRKLRRIGVPYLAADLEPPFGSIDNYVPLIEAAAWRLREATGAPFVIVAHSMGGLAVRSWLTQTSLAHEVSRVITIGTPHRGTWFARLALTRNACQMRPSASWATDLASREAQRFRAPITCFYSNCDNVVVPASSGALSGADNRHLPGLAHVELAFDDAVFDETLRAVAAALSSGSRCTDVTPA